MAEQELNKKLAEWAGFTWHEQRELVDGPLMHGQWYEDGHWDYHGECWYEGGSGEKTHFWQDRLPDFPHDLNACFRWIIPLVSGWDMGSTHDGRTAATVWDHKKAKIRRGFDKEAAMALCKAFEELRKEG